MKTRLMTNKQYDSFRLDIINGSEIETYFFDTQEEAFTFQRYRARFIN